MSSQTSKFRQRSNSPYSSSASPMHQREHEPTTIGVSIFGVTAVSSIDNLDRIQSQTQTWRAKIQSLEHDCISFTANLTESRNQRELTCARGGNGSGSCPCATRLSVSNAAANPNLDGQITRLEDRIRDCHEEIDTFRDAIRGMEGLQASRFEAPGFRAAFADLKRDMQIRQMGGRLKLEVLNR